MLIVKAVLRQETKSLMEDFDSDSKSNTNSQREIKQENLALVKNLISKDQPIGWSIPLVWFTVAVIYGCALFSLEPISAASIRL